MRLATLLVKRVLVLICLIVVGKLSLPYLLHFGYGLDAHTTLLYHSRSMELETFCDSVKLQKLQTRILQIGNNCNFYFYRTTKIKRLISNIDKKVIRQELFIVNFYDGAEAQRIVQDYNWNTRTLQNSIFGFHIKTMLNTFSFTLGIEHFNDMGFNLNSVSKFYRNLVTPDFSARSWTIKYLYGSRLTESLYNVVDQIYQNIQVVNIEHPRKKQTYNSIPIKEVEEMEITAYNARLKNRHSYQMAKGNTFPMQIIDASNYRFYRFICRSLKTKLRFSVKSKVSFSRNTKGRVCNYGGRIFEEIKVRQKRDKVEVIDLLTKKPIVTYNEHYK